MLCSSWDIAGVCCIGLIQQPVISVEAQQQTLVGLVCTTGLPAALAVWIYVQKLKRSRCKYKGIVLFGYCLRFKVNELASHRGMLYGHDSTCLMTLHA